MSAPIKRRDFLKVSTLVGGGMLISLYLPKLSEAKPSLPSMAANFSPNVFIRLGSDESVTIILGKSEMGQGIFTSLPMLVAEELEADWGKVRVEAAPVDSAFNHTIFPIQMTGGSTSTSSEWTRLRKAGAWQDQHRHSPADH